MKKLTFVFCLLFAAPAFAQEPVTFYPDAAQNLAYSSVSVATTDAVGSQINVVRMVCSTDCYVAFSLSGQSAVANDTTGIFLPAGVPEYMRISPNSTVHVVRDISDGTLNVVEVTR